MSLKSLRRSLKKKLLRIGIISDIDNYFKTKEFSETLQPNERGIFVDCGAYDGCSASKFMLANPSFDCISFEPNPRMWEYYTNVPTTLIKKGVSSKNETLEFIIDHIDGDGSSTRSDKIILGDHSLESNTQCEKITIQCVSVPDLIKELSKRYNKIILKLDVEGSEYDILD